MPVRCRALPEHVERPRFVAGQKEFAADEKVGVALSEGTFGLVVGPRALEQGRLVLIAVEKGRNTGEPLPPRLRLAIVKILAELLVGRHFFPTGATDQPDSQHGRVARDAGTVRVQYLLEIGQRQAPLAQVAIEPAAGQAHGGVVRLEGRRTLGVAQRTAKSPCRAFNLPRLRHAITSVGASTMARL